jgi:sensor histidine kinase YesM
VEQYRTLYEEASGLHRYLYTYINELNNARFKNNAENYEALRTSLSYMQTFSAAVLFVAIIGNMFVLVVLASTITRPLAKLAGQAEQVGKGEFDIDFINVESNDEVGILADAFNKMIGSLQAYVAQIKTSMAEESRLKENQLRMESTLKESQLIFLQTQINPHFLYNTLNAGAQMAMMEGAEKTCLFIENLADFFRYSVKRIGQTSNLTEEINQVETYLHIINVRFSGEIRYVKNVSGTIGQTALPGVILQPLVENAINHGLGDIEWEKRITLDAYEESERIVVTVSDNGAGMTQRQIDAILKPLPLDGDPVAKLQRGTGLKNVIERLRLFYKTADVFEITSGGPGTGTSVSIIIPKRSEKNV